MVDGKHLSKFMYPKTQEGREIMKRIPHASTIGSITYSMICTHLDIHSSYVRYMVIGEQRKIILENIEEHPLVLGKH